MTQPIAILLLALLLATAFAFEKGVSQRTRSLELRMFGGGAGGFKERVATVKAPEKVETQPVEIGDRSHETRVGVRTGLHRVADNEQHAQESLERVDRFMRQKLVLASLGEESVLGVVSKAERVSFAAREGLLPSHFAGSLRKSEIASGGLMDDWNFEL